MKNIQPDMDLRKQVHKGIAEMVEAICNDELDKSVYIISLIEEMINSAHNGQPQPWSYYKPRILEEFDD